MNWYHTLTLAQADAPPATPMTNSAPAAAPAQAGATNATVPASNGDAATDQAAGATQKPGGFGMDPIMLLVLFLGVFWLLILMPQRREKKKRAKMLNEIQKGVKVQTIGGILGTVVEVREHEVIVKVDENSNARLRFARGAIQNVLSDGKPQDNK